MSEQFTLGELKQHCSDLYKKGTFRWHLEYLKNSGLKQDMIVVEVKQTFDHQEKSFVKPHIRKNNDNRFNATTILVFGRKSMFHLGLFNILSRVAIASGRKYNDVIIDLKSKIVKYNNENFECVFGDNRYTSEFKPQYFKIEPKNAYYISNGNIEEKKNSLVIVVKGSKMECFYGTANKPDVEMDMNRATMEDIVNGRMTFQRAFMMGQMTAKGNFKTLKMLDNLFPFSE